MPNIVNWTIAAQGNFRNVDQFIQILNNDYDKIHMYRIFSADVGINNTYGLQRKVTIYGECAWSVYVCMFEGPFSYYTEDLAWRKKNKDTTPFTGTTLPRLAKMLCLDISVYSQEPGMCFCEAYSINRLGQILVNKEGYFESYYIEDPNYSFDEFCEDWNYDKEKLPFNEEQYNSMVQNGQECYERAEFEFEDFYRFPRNQMINLVMTEGIKK